MSKSFSSKSWIRTHAPEFNESYKLATDEQIKAMIGAQQSALELCHKWLEKYDGILPVYQQEALRTTLLRIERIAFSLPTDYNA